MALTLLVVPTHNLDFAQIKSVVRKLQRPRCPSWTQRREHLTTWKLRLSIISWPVVIKPLSCLALPFHGFDVMHHRVINYNLGHEHASEKKAVEKFQPGSESCQILRNRLNQQPGASWRCIFIFWEQTLFPTSSEEHLARCISTFKSKHGPQLAGISILKDAFSSRCIFQGSSRPPKGSQEYVERCRCILQNWSGSSWKMQLHLSGLL